MSEGEPVFPMVEYIQRLEEQVADLEFRLSAEKARVKLYEEEFGKPQDSSTCQHEPKHLKRFVCYDATVSPYREWCAICDAEHLWAQTSAQVSEATAIMERQAKELEVARAACAEMQEVIRKNIPEWRWAGSVAHCPLCLNKSFEGHSKDCHHTLLLSSNPGSALLAEVERLRALATEWRDFGPELCQLIDLIDGWVTQQEWSDWDTSVRGRLSRVLMSLEELATGERKVGS